MAAPNKMKELADKYGEPAIDVVLRALNEQGNVPAAARALNLSESNLFRWVRENGIKKSVAWVKSTNQS